MVTVKRLEKFLLLEEFEDENRVSDPHKRAVFAEKYTKHPEDGFCSKINDFTEGINNLGFNNDELEAKVGEDVAVRVRNVQASWDFDVNNLTLDGVDIKIPKGKLCAIIGSVGSGKSSILQLLLKELPVMRGSVQIQGDISYASQEAWLFVATVRNNILFGLPYDQRRYREVVHVCALERDFQQLPCGDQTLVGERGVSLSGGQRARINLARAVYRQADVYLLDDPLSAVDALVGRQLFAECISRYLKGHTTVLVTHQLHFLKAADIIVIMNNGRVEHTGTYDELASSGQDFASLLTAVEACPDQETSRNVALQGISSVISEESDDEEAEVLQSEEQESGWLKKGTYWKYLVNGGTPCFLWMVLIFMLLGQLSASICDYWVGYWTNQQNLQDIHYRAKANTSIDYSFAYDKPNSTKISGASSQLVLGHSFNTFSINAKIGPFSTAEYLYIYTGFVLCCIFGNIFKSTLFFKMCLNASKNLHDQMFHNVLRASMRFFDINPSGRILNRFSKDIGAVDELLPRAIIEGVQIFLVMCSILILISISNVWMLLPIAIIILIFYGIFLLYLKTAQDIKRIEGITKSPVFSHVTATMGGMSTIRISNASERLIKEFDAHQDLHTSSWYQYLACSSHLGFWLDTMCTIFLAVVCYSFILLDTGNSLSGNVGLAVSQCLMLCQILPFGITRLADVVSQMTSVERILQYNKIELEDGLEEGMEATPKNWPSEGCIEFNNVFLRYGPLSDPVLKGLNIHIRSGWKVGIVGRTGAGKSSLITALFRLAPVDGRISIDNVETRNISKQELRSRISIIPQEPVLFSASLRYNLDPFGKYDDTSLWKALEAVELKASIPSLELRVSEGGSNFSRGQRQLVCLARAILARNRLLVLDEATANVDPQTDALIQSTIRSQFKECTVLTIAHRLNTVMDSHRVLVMDSGSVAEYGPPHELLQAEGLLAAMVKETGSDMSSQLRRAAREAHLAKKDE